MADAECAEFLRWALPQLGLRWKGYRNVRGQVCKRISRRIAQLGLSGLDAYRARLEADPAEWRVLDGLCGVTISRCYRDGAVWEALRDDVLPALARAAEEAGEESLRCWSIGCASGEEPYTLSIVWRLGVADRHPGVRLEVLATDFDEQVLERARAGVYPSATLSELPEVWRDRAFQREGALYRVRDEFRDAVQLRKADLRQQLPEGTFRLMLCRNVVLTYVDDGLQVRTLERLTTKLVPGGALVIGRQERWPPAAPLVPWHPALGIFRKPITGGPPGSPP